jgi:hypothetical protein
LLISLLSISRERSPEEVQADALLADNPTGKDKAQSVSPIRAVLPSPSNSAPSADQEKNKTASKNKKNSKGKAAKGDKPRAVAEESPPPAAAVALEGAVEGTEGEEESRNITATGDIDAPAPLTSADGGRAEGGASSPLQDGFLVEWRAESDVLAWTRSATSSGSNTPTLRRLKGPVKDPFSIGTSISISSDGTAVL